MLGIAAATAEALIARRPELTRSGAFLFGDQAFSLFLADQVLHGARLYRDVAYPYGPVPVLLYCAFAKIAGNTPMIYLQFMLGANLVAIGLAYRLVRRAASPGIAVLVTVAGAIPLMIVPGSIVGGYLSSYYMPLERAVLVAGALAWCPPERRAHARAAWLGASIGGLQLIRFGTGIMFGAALFAVDVVLAWRNHAAWRRVTSVWVRTLAVAIAIEVVYAAVVFAILPRPIARDVLWPAYMLDAFAGVASRFPSWSGWRAFVVQDLGVLIAAALTAASAWLWLRRREDASEDAGSTLVLPLMFVIGALGFFRSEPHFRQAAWMLVPGSALVLERLRAARIAAIGWLPILVVTIRSPFEAAPAERVIVTLPHGFTLSLTPAEQNRIARITDVLSHRNGPVLFYPNGTGFYVAFGYAHVGRETWFFPHAIRPYEVDALASAYTPLRTVVVCEPDVPWSTSHAHVFQADIPARIAAPLEARLQPAVWHDADCGVFPVATER